jgi:hypothetical protein
MGEGLAVASDPFLVRQHDAHGAGPRCFPKTKGSGDGTEIGIALADVECYAVCSSHGEIFEKATRVEVRKGGERFIAGLRGESGPFGFIALSDQDLTASGVVSRRRKVSALVPLAHSA